MSEHSGGPAFPGITKVEEYSGSKEQYVEHYVPVGGMSLRDYFAAHAPIERWRYYQPMMPTPRPEPDWTGIVESARNMNLASPNNWDEIVRWDSDYHRESERQWPYFWADAMLAERAKAEAR